MFLAPPRATHHRAGFTLLELLTVVAILFLLGALVLTGGRYVIVRGQTARARAELAVLAGALEKFRTAQGDYPRTDDAARFLQSMLGRRGPGNEPLTGAALIEVTRFSVEEGADPIANPTARLLDPWGRPYSYIYRTQTPWTNPGPVLSSYGPDGIHAPILLDGGYPDHTQPANADNLYATP